MGTADLIDAQQRRKWHEEALINNKLAEQLRQECVDAIARLADAIRFPGIALRDLQEAQKNVAKACALAAQLDPA